MEKRKSLSKKRWTEEETDFLIRNYEKMLYPEIAKKLGRTPVSISKRIGYLGLSLSDEEKHRRFAIPTGIDQTGEKNPNWKGGISKNNYHYRKIQEARYPERCRARRLLRYAVMTGKIKRGKCEVCGSENTHAHHEDYSKPLNVVWLCRPHHRERHGGMH